MKYIQFRFCCWHVKFCWWLHCYQLKIVSAGFSALTAFTYNLCDFPCSWDFCIQNVQPKWISCNYIWKPTTGTWDGYAENHLITTEVC